MKRTILALATFVLGLVAANAQQPNPPPPGGSYNPYLIQGFVSPAPMLPVEFNGTGTLTFDVGNTGSSDIVWVANQSMLVTLSLSYGVPNVADPNDPVQAITAVTGPGAAWFSWEYFPAQRTFRGTQKATIPGGARQTINIAYKVDKNSFITESYKNGFNSNISPPGYTNPQPTDDDTVAAYTYVQAFDYSDAPATYGSSRHEIDLTKQLVLDPNNVEIEVYNSYIYLGALIDPEDAAQPNANALGDDISQTGGLNVDDEDGVIVPTMSPGLTASISYTVGVVDEDYLNFTMRFNGWIDWNHDGDFLDVGERVASNLVVASSGTYNLNVTPPVNAVPGPTFARFRIGPSVTSSTANAAYGEVEDYMFTTNGPSGTVTGHLYVDTNGNGTQDVGEPNLPNVDVIITDSASAVQTVTSDSNGNWTATVPPGSTSIDIDNTDPQYPTGYTQTEGNDPTVVTVLINQSNNGGIDGFFLPATLTGHLYIDTNGNGTQDVGEPNLPNVDVKITDVNSVIQTVTTNASGNWTASVPPGSTSVKIDQTDPQYPTGYTQTEGTDPTVVTAVAGVSTNGGIDGFFLPATLTGHLYIDTNGNGTQDVGEPNLANVDVKITDSNSVIQTVTTNASGNWTASVPPGSTSVKIDQTDPQYPTGYTQTEGTDPTVVTAVAGVSTNGGIDGFYLPSTLTGHLYIDTNGNGTQDVGEPNLPNVDVLITDVLNNTQTVTTDSNGNWTATVPPGSTSANIDETDPDYPTGYTQTEGTDPTVTTAVAGVPTNGGTDGFFSPGSISGITQVDTNADDIGDLTLNNVTYNLLDGAGAPVDNPNLPGIQPYVIVSSNGAYQFTNLPPGQYIVEQVQPTGFLSQRDWDSTADTIGSPVDPANVSRTDNRIPIDLAFGESDTGNNFVEFQCTTTFDAWQLVNSTAGGNAANPDGDIYSNTIEYAFCLPPGSGLGDAYCIEQNITGNFDLVFERVAGGQSDLTLCLRYTDVLTTPAASWTEVTLASLSAITTITPDPSGLVETVRISNVKDLLPSTAQRGFYQFAAKMDYNGDSVIDVIDYTHVSGWQQVDIEANECETYSTPFLPCPLFTGSVTSMTGLTLNLSGSAPLADFTVGSGVLLAAPAKYRIEVQNGPLAGHRFDVASGGLETLTLEAESDVFTGAPFGSLLTTTPSLQTSLVGSQIMLVKYATLEETVPIASVNATSDPTTADRVLYNDGIASWQTYWAFDNGGSPIWVLEGAGLTDRGSDIIAPHQGLFMHTKSQPETIFSFGMVRQSSFAQPISTATPMLSVPYPMNMSPLQMGYLPANFTGSRNPAASDEILQWTSDGYSLTDSPGYSAYWLNKTALRNQWSYLPDTTLVNQNNTAFIKAGRSYYYSTAVAHPAHVVPMPWALPIRFSNLVAP